MKRGIAQGNYAALVTGISRLYESARKTLVRTYWEIGRRIVEAEQSSAPRAEYGEHLLERLSNDLGTKYGEGFSIQNLERMRKFYLTHPKSSTSRELDWSKYVALLSVEDKYERARLERRAYKEDLSVREVREMVRSENAHYENAGPVLRTDSQSSGAVSARVLQCTRGVLNTYGIVDAQTTNTSEGFVTLDLGFNVWREVPAATAKKHTTPAQYFYGARVESVIDGDTLWAVIDCGFRIKVREKLRLRGIDAPDVTTVLGQKAKRFVQRRLKTGAMIVLRTSRSDKYDRYLADVFYCAPAAPDSSLAAIARDGAYLNQELLDAGLAKVFID